MSADVLVSPSLWLIGLLILAVLLAAVEIGYQGHAYMLRRGGRTADRKSPDHLLSAVLGLLALLLGFTFSLALNRYETRRDLVVQEANAIGTVWLRAQLLEEPVRADMRRLLPQYTDARISWSDVELATADMRRDTDLQRALWKAMGAAIRNDSSAQLSRAVMDAMNESFDIASSRQAERFAHIPDRVLHVLLLYATLSMVMLGYSLAANGRPHRIASMLLLLLLSLAFTTILDIDRPRSGSILVSQQPLIDVRQSMR